MKQMIMIVLLTTTLIIMSISGCIETEQQELEEIKIQTMWGSNAQFAGYYVAMEKGYYEKEGIKVVFNEYDENVPVKDAVAEGLADFGIDGANQIIIGRSEGKPLKAVAVHYRMSPTAAFASLKEAEITTPLDWEGKKIGFLPDSTGAIFKTIVNKYGLNESNITYIQYGYDFNLLYHGTVDVIPIYIFDEPYIMEQEGYEIDTILAYDYGIRFYGDTLFTTDQMIENNTNLVHKFVSASLKGWRYAIENPNVTIDIVLKYDHEDYHSREYETYILTHESPLVHTGEDYIGWMRNSVWQEMYNTLSDQGMIDSPINVSECYTMEFLEKIYG
ncbi:MAG: ABC transporter substrate-binding protein [Petrotogales bacterium]